MNALTDFISIILNMMNTLFTEFFEGLNFGNGISIGTIMLAYIVLNTILRYLLGAFSGGGKDSTRDQRRRTQKWGKYGWK